jgi:hypothetical protein
MAAPGKIWGTAIVPGVSRNGRLYTAKLLTASVAQAQERIAAGAEPMVMLTHHGAEDDSTRIVGRLIEVRQRPDGSVAFAAELADTEAGRDIATLVDPKKPVLKGVSIRGWWDGPVRKVEYEGQEVQTGDTLVLDGLDFTKSPGVPGAGVEGSGGLATETADGRTLVYESVTEATTAVRGAPAGAGPFADPGYRDGVKRLPLDTREHTERAWRTVVEADSSGYTAAQLKRVRGRIKKALRTYGADVPTTETTTTRLGDVTEYWGDRDTAGFCIDAYNGTLSLSLRSYGVEPAELRVVAQKAMDAAVNALQALDPDDDAETDDQMETAPPAPAALAQTTPTVPAGETTTPQEVPAVSEQPTNQAAAPAATTPAAPPMIALTQEQFDQLIAQRAPVPATEAAPAAPAAPVAPAPVAETDEQRLARLISAGVTTAMESLKAELRTEMQQTGPGRRGFVAKTTTDESTIPKDKAFDSLPPEQRDTIERDSLLKHFGFAE